MSPILITFCIVWPIFSLAICSLAEFKIHIVIANMVLPILFLIIITIVVEETIAKTEKTNEPSNIVVSPITPITPIPLIPPDDITIELPEDIQAEYDKMLSDINKD